MPPPYGMYGAPARMPSTAAAPPSSYGGEGAAQLRLSVEGAASGGIFDAGTEGSDANSSASNADGEQALQRAEDMPGEAAGGYGYGVQCVTVCGECAVRQRIRVPVDAPTCL